MQSPIPGFYDRGTAARLVRGAAAVYGEAGVMQSWAGAPDGNCHVVESERTETLALVVMDDGQATVAFRGTRDLRNWLSDLDCEKTDYWVHGRVTRIHRGFWRAWGSVREEIASMVERRRVTLTGHSLGGALAMLAAVDLAQSGIEVAGVYTFGQPRVGNAAFSVQYNFALESRTFRVMAPGDVVPWVPYLLASFKHGGREVYLTGENGGNGGVSVPVLEKVRCEVAANWHALRKHRFTPLEAHGVENYMRKLGARSLNPRNGGSCGAENERRQADVRLRQGYGETSTPYASRGI